MDIKICKAEENDKWKADVNLLFDGAIGFIDFTAIHSHAYYAAYDGNEMVALSIILKSEEKWILDGLYVKPEYRRRGIAKKLIEERIKFARGIGAKEIWFNCGDRNIASLKAHDFFEFKKVRPTTIEESPEPSHWYKKDLE